MKAIYALLVLLVGVLLFFVAVDNARSAPTCADLAAKAEEAQAGINVCLQVPGCQVSYHDLLEVRAAVKAAQVCKVNP